MTDTMTLSIATAPRRTSLRWRNGTTTWASFCERLAEPAHVKDCGGYVLGRLVADGPRRKTTIRDRSALAIDLDAATGLASGDVEERLEGLAAALHTTWSSTPDDPRYRLIVPLSRPVDPDEYRHLNRAVCDLIDPDGVMRDPSTDEPERFMYWPATPDPDAYRCWVFDGQPLDADAELADYNPDLSRQHAPAPGTSKRSPYELPGEAGAFNRVYDIDAAIAEFGLPYVPAGPDRWSLVGAKSEAGLHLVGDGLVFSHHATDPAFGRALSAFDLVRVHKYGIQDEGLPEDTPLTVLPSHQSMVILAAQDARVQVELLEVPTEDDFERDVAAELARLQVREEARRRFDELRRPPFQPFDAGTLAEQLAKPEPPPARVDGLIPWDAGTLLIAQRKAGKTTLTLNLARCLFTGEPFLGRFPVRPVKGNIAMLNFEVSGYTLASWAADLRIDPSRLFLVNLRGASNPFTDQRRLAELAALLRSRDVESLIVDPFGRAYSGQSQNDPGEVGHWLADLDRFAREGVGALDVVLTAHAGWNGERMRGASAGEDWPDSILYLTRDEDTELRYLRAIGRDVELDESELTIDGERRLTLNGNGSRTYARQNRKQDDLIRLIVEALSEHPGVRVGELEDLVRRAGANFQKGDVSKAARRGTDAGLLRCEPGERNSLRYFLAVAQEDVL